MEEQLDLLVACGLKIGIVSCRPAAPARWRVREVLTSVAVFFGLDWSGSRVYAACRGDPTDASQAGEAGESVVRLESGTWRAEVIHRSREVVETHQICVVDDSIWIANTGRNCIRIIGLDGHHRADFAPHGEFGGDLNHYNTIRTDGRHVRLVAMNNREGNRTESEVLLVDPAIPETIESIRLPTRCAHDVWFEDGRMLSCDSDRGAVCSPDGSVVRQMEGWLRGVSSHDRWFFAGSSQPAPRKRRHTETSEILLWDNRTSEITGRHPLPGWGQVHDMFLLNRPDRCRGDRAPPRNTDEPWQEEPRVRGP